MPPRRLSRHSFTKGFTDAAGRLYLTDRAPFRFKDLSDTTIHVVNEGDTLFNLAGLYYFGVDRACGLWWTIADFQPDPIIDPTLKLKVGSRLFVPSLRTVMEEIFNEERRLKH